MMCLIDAQRYRGMGAFVIADLRPLLMPINGRVLIIRPHASLPGVAARF